MMNKTVIILLQIKSKSRDSSVGIALGYGLDDRGSRVGFPAGAGNFSLRHRVQTASGAHPASCQLRTGGLSLGVNRPGRQAHHSPASSAEVKECVELYLHSPNTSSWHGAYLSTGTTLPITHTQTGVAKLRLVAVFRYWTNNAIL
jgi:hypothetical protein